MPDYVLATLIGMSAIVILVTVWLCVEGHKSHKRLWEMRRRKYGGSRD